MAKKTGTERVRESRWLQIARAVLATGNPEAAAELAKVKVGTVYRMLAMPAFQARLNAIKQLRFQTAAQACSAHATSDALSVLHGELKPSTSRDRLQLPESLFRDFILKHGGNDLESRLQALEDAASRPTPKLKLKPAPAPMAGALEPSSDG